MTALQLFMHLQQCGQIAWHALLQAGAAAMTAASSAIASANHCNAIFNSCKWTYFIQWTCWNTVSNAIGSTRLPLRVVAALLMNM